MTRADLERRFDYHPATDDETRSAHSAVRSICLMAAIVIDDTTPFGREQALAITNLEQAMFWANAAIARNDKENHTA